MDREERESSVDLWEVERESQKVVTDLEERRIYH